MIKQFSSLKLINYYIVTIRQQHYNSSTSIQRILIFFFQNCYGISIPIAGPNGHSRDAKFFMYRDQRSIYSEKISIGFKWDTELSILCYVKKAHAMFLFTFRFLNRKVALKKCRKSQLKFLNFLHSSPAYRKKYLI